MSDFRKWATIIVQITGRWWAIMSGAVSIPLAFLALVFGGKPGTWLAILGYVALWSLVIKMACTNYKARSKKAISTMLCNYFREIDMTLQLLEIYKLSNDMEKAKTLFLQQAKACEEIRDYIAEVISPAEATLFSAKSQIHTLQLGVDTKGFFDSSIEFFTDKLRRLEGIMKTRLS
jgi:hypothetical protein